MKDERDFTPVAPNSMLVRSGAIFAYQGVIGGVLWSLETPLAGAIWTLVALIGTAVFATLAWRRRIGRPDVAAAQLASLREVALSLVILGAVFGLTSLHFGHRSAREAVVTISASVFVCAAGTAIWLRCRRVMRSRRLRLPPSKWLAADGPERSWGIALGAAAAAIAASMLVIAFVFVDIASGRVAAIAFAVGFPLAAVLGLASLIVPNRIEAARERRAARV